MGTIRVDADPFSDGTMDEYIYQYYTVKFETVDELFLNKTEGYFKNFIYDFPRVLLSVLERQTNKPSQYDLMIIKTSTSKLKSLKKEFKELEDGGHGFNSEGQQELDNLETKMEPYELILEIYKNRK